MAVLTLDRPQALNALNTTARLVRLASAACSLAAAPHSRGPPLAAAALQLLHNTQPASTGPHLHWPPTKPSPPIDAIGFCHPHLRAQAMREVVSACLYLDRQHPGARAVIITGAGSKAFAAGADVKEMAAVGYAEVGGVRGARRAAC